MTNDNLHSTSVIIDRIRFAKEDELADLLAINDLIEGTEEYERLKAVINGDINFLPEDQKRIIRGIKFLNNLALTVLHQ